MRYKRAKEIIENDFSIDNIHIKFGWKFRIYPRLRKQIKQWGN